MRISAISMPGIVLSQPAMPTTPSKLSPCATSSTESAIQSRETSDARMPSLPIAIPSETEIVSNSSANTPRRVSSRATSARISPRFALHGVTRFQVAATPTCGLRKSSSPKPIARSIARGAAPRGPS